MQSCECHPSHGVARCDNSPVVVAEHCTAQCTAGMRMRAQEPAAVTLCTIIPTAPMEQLHRAPLRSPSLLSSTCTAQGSQPAPSGGAPGPTTSHPPLGFLQQFPSAWNWAAQHWVHCSRCAPQGRAEGRITSLTLLATLSAVHPIGLLGHQHTLLARNQPVGNHWLTVGHHDPQVLLC